MDILNYNRDAWNLLVEQGNEWTVPVDQEQIEEARKGKLNLLLTPSIPVPLNWYPPLEGLSVLCLASGGGQQAPLLAAAGAKVTCFDNSPNQLKQDQTVAEREGLAIETVQGDMADLSVFADESFGLIFHPCSNCFAPNIRPVWNECYRVLKPGGVLLSGFCNPVRYLFEDSLYDNGVLNVKFKIPHSDATDISEEYRKKYILDQNQPLEFGHTLDDQIGGQIDAGFIINGFFEDRFIDCPEDPISEYIDSFISLRAIKPANQT